MGNPDKPFCLTGLSAAQVQQKKESGKQNLPPEKSTKSTSQILKDNICTLFNLFNVLIAIALALVGAWSNMMFICIIAVNTLIGIVQELHAKKLVEKLSLLSAPTVRVIRDGKHSEIPIHELVEQDVIELEAGNQVCSDCVILVGEAEVNESLLTGESDPVLKPEGSHLLSGSFIVSGRCRACVEHVGVENYAAAIAREAKRLRGIHSELLSSMRKVTHFTAFLIPPLGILLFLEAFLLRGDTLNHAVVTTAAGLLGMLPKGLVLLISISLAVGIITLSRKKVLVQELFALETLAHVDTLCLDKTGTLTQGKMQVEKVYSAEPQGSVLFEELIGSFLQYTDDNNATFQALKAHFAASDVFSPIHKIPFSSERKWSAIEFQNAGTFVIGAPERLGASVPPYLERDEQTGKRLLLAGYTKEPLDQNGPLPHIQELAYIVISDSIRPNAAETLAYFQKEGVALKLISGDNPVTVSALAKQVGFPEAERYLDMTGITEEAQIEKAAADYSIFGRVSPLQKKQLVQALQKKGHAVAMTGDVAGVFFVKTIYSVLLSLVCLVLNIPFPFMPIQITLIDLIIEGYPAFFISFEPDNRRITGRFLPSVLRRAFPNAVSILICFVVLLALSWVMPIPTAQFDLLLYLLVGTVGIQAVFKASWPLNRLRTFLCCTMTAGFYLAVFLFHSMLQVSLPTSLTLLLLAGFIPLSFLAERGISLLIRNLDRRKNLFDQDSAERPEACAKRRIS